MEQVYLDNASTTSVLPEVIETITTVLTQTYGNPSSTHATGRAGKVQVETARKAIAKHFNAQASEIVFTSCGTEGDNWILKAAVQDLGVTQIITTKIEHHAVLHTIEILQLKNPDLKIQYLSLDSEGHINIKELRNILDSNPQKTLVSLMHVNNEIGTVLNLKEVGAVCKEFNTYFHTDTVQSVGKEIIDVQENNIDFLVASSHKFHGPKGIGFVYIKKNTILQPLIYGGEQEKGSRAGTEAVHQIVGMAKALDIAYKHLEMYKNQIQELKNYAILKFQEAFLGVKFNGGIHSFYNILNVNLPLSKDKTSMILFYLDMQGIAVSRGSACQSGSLKPSHVLAEILSQDELLQPSLRLSFSHFNTKQDIDKLIDALLKM